MMDAPGGQPQEIEHIPPLPEDAWAEVFHYVEGFELEAASQVSHGLRDAVHKHPGVHIVAGPKELAAALADPEARWIIVKGGAGATVSSKPTNNSAFVVTTGHVAATGKAVLYVRNGEVTATGKAIVIAAGSAHVDVSENATAQIYEAATATVTGPGRVVSYSTGVVTASGHPEIGDTVHAFGAGPVSAAEGAIVVSGEEATGTVTLTNHSAATIYGAAEVLAINEATVILHGRGKATVSDTTHTHLDGAGSVEASGNARVIVTGTGTVQGIGEGVRILATASTVGQVQVDHDHTVRIADEENLQWFGRARFDHIWEQAHEA